jgi:hypothetical protein
MIVQQIIYFGQNHRGERKSIHLGKFPELAILLASGSNLMTFCFEDSNLSTYNVKPEASSLCIKKVSVSSDKINNLFHPISQYTNIYMGVQMRLRLISPKFNTVPPLFMIHRMIQKKVQIQNLSICKSAATYSMLTVMKQHYLITIRRNSIQLPF